MAAERILITVRTYPNLSTKHIETVCTGGINDHTPPEWRRLYPVPLRLLDDERQYKTFDVVRVSLGRNPDSRPESRTPDTSTLEVVGHLDDWQARKDWILPTAILSMRELRASNKTLAPVRVSEVMEFKAVPDSDQWEPKQIELLRQQQLFDGPKPLEKLPFDFRLRWRDGEGEEIESKFLAWEVGETWRKYRQKYTDPIAKMQDAWMTQRFGPGHDVWFFMGNFAAHRQHFGVCGTFTPPKENDPSGSLWSDR